MTAGFREQALHEMGLAPLWLRRDAIVADTAAVRAPEVVPEVVPAVAPENAQTALAAPARFAPRAKASASAARARPDTAPAMDLPPESDFDSAYDPAFDFAFDSLPSALADAQADGAGREAGIALLPWESLADAVAQCSACPLCHSRQRTVFGAGIQGAPWMLVGEAPGEAEDASGMPFVGPAGHLLDNMLRAAGVSREQETYITNTVKCHPPAARRPEPDEVRQCAPYLQRQIALVQPRLILALGAVAAQSLLGSDEPVSSLRGRVHHQRFGDREIAVIVTFHPAYVLRKLTEKAKTWADLCLAVETMRQMS